MNKLSNLRKYLLITLKYRANISIVLLFIIFSIVSISSVVKDSLTYDEDSHYNYGLRFFKNTLDHTDMLKMPISALNALPSMITELLNIKVTERTRLFICRLPTILISLLLAFLVYRWSRKLYGVYAGIGALLLYIFCPNIIAHSRLITNDIYCAFFCTISLYFLSRYLKENTIKSLLLLSFTTGIAQISKASSLILYPLYGIIIIHFILFIKKDNLLKFVSNHKLIRIALHFIIFICINVIIINSSYRFNNTFKTLHESYNSLPDWVKPAEKGDSYLMRIAENDNLISKIKLPLPSAYIETILLGSAFNGLGVFKSYSLGVLSNYGGYKFFLITLLLKIPIAIMIFVLLRIFISIGNNLHSRIDEVIIIWFLLIELVVFTFFCKQHIGIRYVVMIFPSLYIYLGANFNFKYLKSKLIKSFIPLVTVYLIISSLSFYPHYISYFNEFVFERKNMYKYLADSNVEWGQDEYYLTEYINKNNNIKLSFYPCCYDVAFGSMLSNCKNLTINPNKIENGIIIVSVNRLVGICNCDSDRPELNYIFKNITPTERISYSYLVFEINEKTEKISMYRDGQLISKNTMLSIPVNTVH